MDVFLPQVKSFDMPTVEHLKLVIELVVMDTEVKHVCGS